MQSPTLICYCCRYENGGNSDKSAEHDRIIGSFHLWWMRELRTTAIGRVLYAPYTYATNNSVSEAFQTHSFCFLFRCVNVNLSKIQNLKFNQS